MITLEYFLVVLIVDVDVSERTWFQKEKKKKRIPFHSTFAILSSVLIKIKSEYTSSTRPIRIARLTFAKFFQGVIMAFF